MTASGVAPSPELRAPRQRLRAIRTLIDAGIDASVGMAPILPGISDDPAGMATVVRAARDAGATSIWANVLYLRPGTREHFLDNLARDWPELLPRYEALYAGRCLPPGRDRSRAFAAGCVTWLATTASRTVAKTHLCRHHVAIAEQLPLTAFVQAPTGDA